MTTLELKTRILPGGRNEVQAPGLVEGQEVTLNIIVDDEAQPAKKSLLENLADLKAAQLSQIEEGKAPSRRISDILADYPGGQGFKSAAEVDHYLKEERESWDD